LDSGASAQGVAVKSVLVALGLVVATSFARGTSYEAFVGASSPHGEWEPRVSWSVAALHRIDQMVAAGLAAGYEAIPTHSAASLTSRLQVRLPFGRQLLPYVQAEAGAGIRPVLTDTYFLWKLGGGLDLKLGDRSSLLLEGGAQTFGRTYGRVGLLLEL
jgi:hypothetical protein